MQIFFGGAEKGKDRRTLLTAGVERMAINLTHLAIPKRKAWSVPEAFPGISVAVYTSQDDTDLERYSEFVRSHFDDLTVIIGRQDYKPEEWVLEKYYPLWADGDDLDRAAYLCETYHRIAVPDRSVADARTRTRLKALMARHGVSALALTSKSDVIDALPWDIVVAGSWSSAGRYGETQVWDGRALRRYPAQRKASALKKHRAHIAHLGCDYESLLDGDVSEASLLAVKSWQAYEANRTGYRPAGAPTEADDDEREEAPVATIAADRSPALRAAPGGSDVAIELRGSRHERARVLLPMLKRDTITVEDEDDLVGATVEVSTLRIRSESARQCSSCYLAAHCPEFEDGANCAYAIPLEIKTKDQLAATAVSLIEMQVGRAMFAAWGEQLEGSGVDASVSAELDRVFSMMGRLKDFTAAADTLRLSVEASGTMASAGVLSRVFGAQVGEKAKELPNGGLSPQTTDKLIAEVINVK